MQLSQPQSQQEISIPDGRAGIAATLDYMTAFVRQYKRSPAVRNMAIELTRYLPPKQYTLEVKALFEFVQNEVRYMHDITDVETLQSPDVTLSNRVGDCDDKSTLLAALLESTGHKTRFIAAAFDDGFGMADPSHVFVETIIGTNWVALDATEMHPMGWRPPGISYAMVRNN